LFLAVLTTLTVAHGLSAQDESQQVIAERFVQTTREMLVSSIQAAGISADGAARLRTMIARATACLTAQTGTERVRLDDALTAWELLLTRARGGTLNTADIVELEQVANRLRGNQCNLTADAERRALSVVAELWPPGVLNPPDQLSRGKPGPGQQGQQGQQGQSGQQSPGRKPLTAADLAAAERGVCPLYPFC
jgi:hypothetical protein